MTEFAPAVRTNTAIVLALAGASGSDSTKSALESAVELVDEREQTPFRQWRFIPSFPEYQASDDGTIQRLLSSRFSGPFEPLTPYLSKTGGYPTVGLWDGTKTVQRPVHALVCEAFHGLRPSREHDCAHWDGDKTNNRPSNLRWATRAENEADKVRHGRSNRGERGSGAKLTVEQVKEIREAWPLLPRSVGGTRVANGATGWMERKFGVTRSALYNIATRRHWK